MTERYNGAARLRRLYGMRGYGVYCRVVELCLSAPNKRLFYDLDDLVYDIREDKTLIKEIVEAFGLFVIDGEYIEDIYSRSPEAVEKERQAQIKLNRSLGARKAAATRRAKKEARARAEQEQAQAEPQIVEQPTQNVELEVLDEPVVPFVEDAAPDEPDETQTLSKRYDAAVAEWNKAFARTRRVVTQITPDAITWNYFKQAAAIYEDADFKDAFEQAKNEQFAWQFRDAVKPSNMQRLLSNYETERRRKGRADDNLTFEQREIIEYAEKRGWNWN